MFCFVLFCFVFFVFLQEERLEGSPLRMYARQSSSSSIVDGISRGIMGAGPAMVERLQAQVKQKDGEIEVLQVPIFLCNSPFILE